MARLPQDASLDVQTSIRELNDEIIGLRKGLAATKSTIPSTKDIEDIRAAIVRLSKTPTYLDFNDIFRGSGPAHMYGYVPDPGVTAGTEKFLREDGTWANPDGPYGSFYGNDIAWNQAAATQNQWYTIADADISDGLLGSVTHDGSGKLTVAKAGIYLITYSMTIECGSPNKHVEHGISVDGSVVNDARGHFHVVNTASELSQSSVGILSLNANSTVELAVRCTDTGTPSITVDHVNLAVVRVRVS